MNILRISILALTVLFPALGWGELHIIVGTATPIHPSSYATDLYELGRDGNLRHVAELVPQRSGTYWIAVSYESRRGLVLPKEPRISPIVVVDLDSASVVKRCMEPAQKGASRIKQWLANVPTRGLTFETHFTTGDHGSSYVAGMDMDPSVPCDKSFLRVHPSEVRHISAHGSAGVGEIINFEGIDSTITSTGQLAVNLAQSSVFLDYVPPAELRSGISKATSNIVVNTSQVLVLSIASAGEMVSRHLVFRKSNKRWVLLPLACGDYTIRAFGKYVVAPENRDDHQRPLTSGFWADSLSVKSSPGEAAWRANEVRTGPSVKVNLESAPVRYSGRLDIFDSETERLFVIDTNQADSEVILIEDGAVYYRISDQLFSAPIAAAGIGRPSLIGQNELVRDAHWAFIKR